MISAALVLAGIAQSSAKLRTGPSMHLLSTCRMQRGFTEFTAGSNSAMQQAAEYAMALSSSPRMKRARLLLAAAGIAIKMVQVVYTIWLQWLIKE